MKKKFKCPITGSIFTAMFVKMPQGTTGWLIETGMKTRVKSKPEEWIEIPENSSLLEF